MAVKETNGKKRKVEEENKVEKVKVSADKYEKLVNKKRKSADDSTPSTGKISDLNE